MIKMRPVSAFPAGGLGVSEAVEDDGGVTFVLYVKAEDFPRRVVERGESRPAVAEMVRCCAPAAIVRRWKTTENGIVADSGTPESFLENGESTALKTTAREPRIWGVAPNTPLLPVRNAREAQVLSANRVREVAAASAAGRKPEKLGASLEALRAVAAAEGFTS